MGLESGEILFWWGLNLCARLFGVLLLVGGVIVALLFALNLFVLEPSEDIRLWVGSEMRGEALAIGLPLGAAALGLVLVRFSNHYPSRVRAAMNKRRGSSGSDRRPQRKNPPNARR